MTWPGRLVRRNRGLIAALGLSSIAWSAAAWAWPPGPRASRAEVVRPSDADRNSGVAEVRIISPDGRAFLTAGEAGLRVRDLASGRIKELDPGGAEGSRRFLDGGFLDGGRFVIACQGERDPAGADGRSVQIWETASGRPWARLPGVDDSQHELGGKISADGSTFACPPKYEQSPGGRARHARVWKAAWGREVRAFPGADPIALSGDGRHLALGAPGSPMASVDVYEVDAGRRIASIPVGPGLEFRDLALSADGTLLAENLLPGTALWDVATGTRLATLATKGYPIRFQAGGPVLLLGKLGAEGVPGEAWDVASTPPRPIFRGTIWHTSSDGRRIIKSGPGPSQSSAAGDPVVLVERPAGRRPGFGEGSGEMDERYSPDGRLAATLEYRAEASPVAMAWRRLPGFLRPILRRYRWSRSMPTLRVVDTRSRRTVATVGLPANLGGRPECEWVDGGKALAVDYTLAAGPGATDVERRVEVWDVPAPFRWGWAASALGVVSLGVALDLLSNGRASRIAAPPPHGSDASP